MNPYLTTTLTPDLSPGVAIAFSQLTPALIAPAVEEVLRGARATIDELLGVTTARTYDNTVAPLDELTDRVNRLSTLLNHLEHVASTDAFRAEYERAQEQFTQFYTDLYTNTPLFKVLSGFARSPDGAALEGVHKRFIVRALDRFRREGAELSPEKKVELRAINEELARLTQSFGHHVVDATKRYELLIADEGSLSGLPAREIEAARERARERGVPGYRFTLQAPSYLAVMTYLDDRKVREEIYRAYNSRCIEGDLDNRELARRIVELRARKSELIGYPSFAALTLEDRMARSPDVAMKFLTELEERARPAMARETEELRSFARTHLGLDDLAPWDVAYVAEKLLKARFDFDEESLRPYFPLPRVLEGIRDLASLLFGITIVEDHTLEVWNAEVQVYRATDEDGSLLGYFYLDLFPRDDKHGGAWAEGLVTGERSPQGWSPHLGAIGCNASRSVGGAPPLLSHDQTLTLLHEFGHLFHHLCSRVEVKSLAGMNVAWDFVELMSQILENWGWEREGLARLSGHVESGEAIPQEMVDRVRSARTFRAATHLMRQLGFATLDLKLHSGAPLSSADAFAEYCRAESERYSPLPLPAYYGMAMSFTHLFGDPVGYAAGYYSYKWSEMLDADAFTRFLEEGVVNPKVGREFRDIILARGDSEDASELYRQFRGRAPAIDALLVREGIASPP